MNTKLQNNKIIKLLEKIAEQNEQIINHLNHNGLVYPHPMIPRNPFYSYPSEEDNPYRPFTSSNVICPHCDRDTGIPMMLHMVIPAGGLRCPHCDKVAVLSNTITCKDTPSTRISTETTTLKPYESVCTNTTNFDPNIKGYNKRETTPITHRSYDGTKTTLPATTPEKWTGTASQLNDFLWENRHNL